MKRVGRYVTLHEALRHGRDGAVDVVRQVRDEVGCLIQRRKPLKRLRT